MSTTSTQTDGDVQRPVRRQMTVFPPFSDRGPARGKPGVLRADRRPEVRGKFIFAGDEKLFAAVEGAFAQEPFGRDIDRPRISVVVCTHNGSRTIEKSCQEITRLDYPDYEVIVVDNGSTDGTAAIVRKYDVKLIQTENQGLSSARNVGANAAAGEIIAYIDDDAWRDRHWLPRRCGSAADRRRARTSDSRGDSPPSLKSAREGNKTTWRRRLARRAEWARRAERA